MTQGMTPARRAALNRTAGTYTSTVEAQGALGIHIPRTDAPYMRRIAETSPQGAEPYSLTGDPQGASVILYPVVEA